MVKTTFNERFDKAVKFYDHTYHMHKATFKGLASFYKDYSNAEKDYASAIINLTKNIWHELPQLRTENTTLLSCIKEIINSMQTTSQLHFNYGQRLAEVGTYYHGEYLSSKKKKDNHMKIIRDRNMSEYEGMRNANQPRSALNQKEKEICKVVYENMDKLAEEENDRIQKIKEQTIIYFSLYKKICEKELEKTSEYNLKMVKQEFQVKNPGILEIAEEVRCQHNEYGGEQIDRRSYDVNHTMVYNRESLRQSMLMRQRLSKVTDYQSELKKVVDRYSTLPDQLDIMNEPNTLHGFLDEAYFDKEKRHKVSREFSGATMRAVAYDMLDGYTSEHSRDSDTLMILQLIKANLKVNSTKAAKGFGNISEYWKLVQDKEEGDYKWHVGLLQELWGVYESGYTNIHTDSLDAHIRNKRTEGKLRLKEDLTKAPFQIATPILSILLDSLCSNRADEPVLVEGFSDFLVPIAKFGEAILGMERSFTVIILLKKVERLISEKETNEELELILNEGYFSEILGKKKEVAQNDMEYNKEIWVYGLINNCTQKMSHFYTRKPSLTNYIKIFLLIERLGLIKKQRFNARERTYLTLKCAGYNFLKSSEASLKILDSEGWTGEERLKNIVEITEDLDYEGIMNNFINPSAMETASLLGVGENKVQSKMFDEFTEPFYKIMETNLNMISEQEGTDRDGYALRLGIILSRLDMMNPLPLNQYDSFFKVLEEYLASTEKDYDKMLEHSRQTELWIMEENSLATPNCIDFCSLLYKPFEFLLISLKKLDEARKTDFTRKYAEFIKLRLNNVLRDQIIKYVNFLHESLTLYQHAPLELSLKPRKLEKLHKIEKDQTDKDRYNFKELTRRLFNLLFLKEQLEEMICDFVDPELYKKLGNSIFNLDKLKKYASQSTEYREMLTNIKDIVEAVLANEDKIVKRVANITVHHFFRKLFDNLYFQDEKNAISEFFSSDADYKLSQYTFVFFQENLEQWFALISKNIPDEFLTNFSEQFSRAFFEAIRYEALNSNKFKIPISSAKTVPYLDSDVAFVTTMMKQKFFEEQVIEAAIQKPFQKVLQDLRSDTGKLCGVFESATLKNDKQKCKYVLVILNLRPRDEKAAEFIKKYKTIVK